jgi:fatty acid desaturase
MEWLTNVTLNSKKFVISQQNALLHNMINTLSFLLLISLFAFGIEVTERLGFILSLFVMPIYFGILLFSFYVLVVHEASHQMFIYIPFNKKLNLWLNRIIAVPICALSFQDFYYGWEKGHFIHHREPIKDHDPQNCPSFCLYGNKLIIECLKVLFLPGYAFFKQSSCTLNKKREVIIGFFEGVLAWSAFYFFLPIKLETFIIILISSNVAMVINLVKVSMEHAGAVMDRDDLRLRSKSSFFLLRHLIMPFNITLHFEHHIHPRVPWYRLSDYHKLNRTMMSEQEQKEVFNLNTKQTLSQILDGGHALS